MTVSINGKEIKCDSATSLGALLTSQNIDPIGKAIAVNGAIIGKELIASHMLSDGDNIIIIKAFYGG